MKINWEKEMNQVWFEVAFLNINIEKPTGIILKK